MQINKSDLTLVSDEDISNDAYLSKNINGNKSSKLSLQSRLQGM